MCIQPNDNWQWHYDAQDDRLMLDLSDRMIFATEYKGRHMYRIFSYNQLK
ncbi:hypothetical protein KAM475_21820 [Aeromonas caviae]|nr:hypothetical protein KAM475_21820 [Aeromonas caviae]